jgi:hypothetical protein
MNLNTPQHPNHERKYVIALKNYYLS